MNGALQAIISHPNSSSSLQFFSSDDIDEFLARVASAKPPRAMKPCAKKLITSHQSSSVEEMNPSPVRTVVNSCQLRQAQALFNSSHPDPQPQASILDNADAQAATTRRIYNPYRQLLRPLVSTNHPTWWR